MMVAKQDLLPSHGLPLPLPLQLGVLRTMIGKMMSQVAQIFTAFINQDQTLVAHHLDAKLRVTPLTLLTTKASTLILLTLETLMPKPQTLVLLAHHLDAKLRATPQTLLKTKASTLILITLETLMPKPVTLLAHHLDAKLRATPLTLLTTKASTLILITLETLMPKRITSGYLNKDQTLLAPH